MRREINNVVVRKLIYHLAGALALWHVLLATLVLVDTIYIVSVDLMIAMVLIFLLYPAGKWSPKHKPSGFDILLSIAAAMVGVYTIVQYPSYMYRMGSPTSYDITMGCIALVLTLEAARRTVGVSLPIIAVCSIIYCFLGHYIPGHFATKQLSLGRVVFHLYCGLEGIYGVMLIVMGTVIFLFILFAAFIRNSAMSQFVMDFSCAVIGKTAGGPAKLAVGASGFMGMLTGAAVANVAATGNITIPLMKKCGYRPHIAGAIEAAASSGGQMMPPVMGATAFIIAEVTGVSYSEICIVSFLPATLYICSLWFYVHLEAKKYKMQTMDEKEIPNAMRVIKEGGHLMIPMILLFYLILMDYSLARAALVSVAATFFSSLIRKDTRMGLQQIKTAFQESGLDMLMLLAAGASAGIILGVVWLTGVGLKFSSFFLDVAGQNLFLMLCLVAFVSLIFGMGLPVVASYIVLATLAGPALEGLGIPALVAHLVIFWFSVDALVTPPVAMAAYVAAGIAKAPIMPTALESWKAAKALYVVPFLMVYGPLITGDFLQKIEVFLMALLGFYAMVAAFKGYFLNYAFIWERILLALAALLLFLPGDKSYLPLTHLAGLILFAGLLVINKMTFVGPREHSAMKLEGKRNL